MTHKLSLAFALTLAFSANAFAQDVPMRCSDDPAVSNPPAISSVEIGENANAGDQGEVAIGNGATAINSEFPGPSNVAVGRASNATGGVGATATGDSAVAQGDNATATGSMATASGCGATATGAGSYATYRATATGHFAQATGDGSVANGNGARASGTNSSALGSYSQATGENSTAVGSGARATHDNSVALGAGTHTERPNEVNVGGRQIGGVQDATWDRDAVNLRQMRAGDEWALNQSIAYTDLRFNQVSGRINRVGAMGTAMAMMTGSAASVPGKNKWAVGAGNYNGKNAFAIGYQRAFTSKSGKPMSFTLGAAFSGSDRSVGIGLAGGF